MNLDSTLRGYDDTLAKNPSDMPGEIGAVINGKRRTNVVGRGGFVYVRLRTNLSEPIQAYNDKVFPGFGVAVIVRWANNRYEIVGRDSQRYQEWETDTPEISKHGNSHSLDVEGGNIGTDPAWIYPYQFISGLVSPYNQSGAQNVYVHPFPILYGGEWIYAGNTGTSSLITYSPSSGTVFVLITVDAETGNPALFATTGTYVTWNISGSNQYIPYLPNVDTVRYLPLSFAILQSGTTSMSWSNLRDIRQWISTSQSGTGGGASLAFQDEGIPLGTPGTVNFVGGNVSVTISGTVARVFVTGSSVGTTDHNSLTGLQGGTGSQYYHLSYPEWGGLITGSLTYLHKHSAVDIVTGTMATARLGSGTANAGTFLSGDQTFKPAHSFIVKNTSGATANAGDIGYINQAGEYKTTTTTNFIGAWVIVIVGAANNSDIYVTNRGRIDVNYTGTDPSAGEYLVTSTSAGLAQRQATMRPEIFAVCLAAGSGGVVSVLLLTQTLKIDLYSSNNFWRNNAHSTTIFTGTINGAPTATSVVYTVSTGNEDIFAVLGTGELAKIMLYNSTRGTYRLITACNTGTNTLTTVSSTDAWANGDTITVLYQTINDTTAGQTFVGLDLSQQSEIPILARSVILQGGVQDTGGAGRTLLFHPNEALSTSKILTVQITQTTQQNAYHVSFPLINRILGMKTVATGTGTALTVIKLAGYYLAAP